MQIAPRSQRLVNAPGNVTNRLPSFHRAKLVVKCSVRIVPMAPCLSDHWPLNTEVITLDCAVRAELFDHVISFFESENRFGLAMWVPLVLRCDSRTLSVCLNTDLFE